MPDGCRVSGESTEAFVDIKGLSYAYPRQRGDWALSEVDLAVRPQDYLLVAGASGSGKSTLLRTFNGLVPLFYGGRLVGRVRVDGRETAGGSVKDLFGRVGMVFQNPEAQLFNRTVDREIAFGLESLGLPREEIGRRISGVARKMAIDHLMPRHPHTLSGGEQQLVCIAAILALSPKVMVLDEPYANLDPATVWAVRKALREIHDQGTGVVVGEHRMGYSAPDAGRMVIMDRGRIVADGTPESLLTPGAQRHYGLVTDTLVSEKTTAPSAPGPSAVKAETCLSVEMLSHETAKRRLLERIAFDLKKGECLALVGANGAGKTTLLKHLNGLIRPTQGRILLQGKDISGIRVSRLARHVGMAFQNPSAQFFRLTVEEEILAGPKALGRVDGKWIDSLVALFRLSPLMDRSPFRLSSGEKKRVAIAAALAVRPDILALDEPTAGQDGHFRSALCGFLAELRHQGQSVIMATHDLGFARDTAHRWLVMARGRMVATGMLIEILDDDAVMACAGLRPPNAG